MESCVKFIKIDRTRRISVPVNKKVPLLIKIPRLYSLVHGSSMHPTLRSGDIVRMSRVFNRSKIKRGDVVVGVPFNYTSESESVVKRVVATAGDIVVWSSKDKLSYRVYFKEELSDSDEYAISPEDKYEVVPDHCVFLIGDNTAHSFDSRNFGSVNLSDIYYKVKGRSIWTKMIDSMINKVSK